MTAINEYLGCKLRALSFFAIILVVFVHSYNAKIRFESGELDDVTSNAILFFENFLSKGICRVAVPLFFLISGFLFHLTLNFSLTGIIDKYKKRVKSLLIPYLFWSVFGVFIFLLLQAFPFSRFFFTRGLIIDYSFLKLMRTIFLDPIPYQFWFIRDLILLVLLSPLIAYLTKSTKGLWILVLIFLWYQSPASFGCFSNESLLFFTIGGHVALNKSAQFLSPIRSKRFLIYLTVCWICIVSITSYLLTFIPAEKITIALDHTGVLIGILSVWLLYDSLFHAEINYALFGYTFIIFALHEPLLTIIVKGLFYVCGKTTSSTLFIYLFAPLITILICLLCGVIWKRSAPRLYDFATGGR
jgi:fucose 4-O-acetylase-like acetyltransferase